MLIFDKVNFRNRIFLFLAAKILISAVSAENSGRRAEARLLAKKHHIRLSSHSSEATDLNSAISVEAEALPVLTLNGTYSLKGGGGGGVGGGKASKTSKKKSKRDKKKTKGESFSPGKHSGHVF